MDGPFNVKYDQRDDLEDEIDEGWIGENAHGIWTTRHPLAALTEAPELWRVVSRWKHGDREPGLHDLKELTAVEAEAKLMMCAASGRALQSRFKKEG